MNRREFIVSAAALAAMPQATIEALARKEPKAIEALPDWEPPFVGCVHASIDLNGVDKVEDMKFTWTVDEPNAEKFRKLGVKVERLPNGMYKLLLDENRSNEK